MNSEITKLLKNYNIPENLGQKLDVEIKKGATCKKIRTLIANYKEEIDDQGELLGRLSELELKIKSLKDIEKLKK